MSTLGLTYTASATAKRFLRSDHPFRILAGPVGGGKSVACVIEVLRRCMQMPTCKDGKRRSRWVIVRNTSVQLRDTTLKTWLDWIRPGVLGYWKESEKTFFLRFNDVEAEILFRPLDTPEDVQRVLSLEVTGAFVNECKLVPREIIEALQARIGRYPRREETSAFWHGLIADTNMPELDTFWANVMQGLPTEKDNPDSVVDVEVFIQPDALSPLAENVENLPPGYYDRISQGKSAEWVNVYVRAQYGTSLSGVPVYRSSFKYEKHVSPTPLPIYSNLPVVIGMDFGRTPAAVFKQMTMDGRINTLRECVAFGVGIDALIAKQLRPTIRNCFPTNPLVFIGDPSGVKQNDTDNGTCFKSLKAAFGGSGAVVKPARTNDPILRINATEQTFLAYPGGELMHLVDPSCKWLIEAFRGKYRHAHVRNPDLEHSPSPQKNDWSHVAEAEQYASLFLMSDKYRASDYIRIDLDNPMRSVLPVYRPPTYIGY
jgi:hypothetical protein